jgi:hypothetical protein
MQPDMHVDRTRAVISTEQIFVRNRGHIHLDVDAIHQRSRGVDSIDWTTAMDKTGFDRGLRTRISQIYGGGGNSGATKAYL